MNNRTNERTIIGFTWALIIILALAFLGAGITECRHHAPADETTVGNLTDKF